MRIFGTPGRFFCVFLNHFMLPCGVFFYFSANKMQSDTRRSDIAVTKHLLTKLIHGSLSGTMHFCVLSEFLNN